MQSVIHFLNQTHIVLISSTLADSSFLFKISVPERLIYYHIILREVRILKKPSILIVFFVVRCLKYGIDFDNFRVSLFILIFLINECTYLNN
jgi:hypothetical protein